jgi:hypothetical protein
MGDSPSEIPEKKLSFLKKEEPVNFYKNKKKLFTGDIQKKSKKKPSTHGRHQHI